MKRIGYLIEKIADLDNLELAFYKAKRGKSHKKSVQQFEANLSENLFSLHRQILAGEVEVGKYHYFKVFDPKERTICAADFSERVLHHALMNVCHPYFENAQIPDSYASRKGKGTYKALDRAKQYTQKYAWYLKLDFRKYFDSISHLVLKVQLERKFKDPKLLHIFGQIIDTYQANLSFRRNLSSEHEAHFGLPIGNLTSQYFANHYLSTADHYAKDRLKAKAYVRYMDDVVFWHNDKKALLDLGKAYHSYTSQTLKLELKPFCLNRASEGLPFLGYILYPNKVRLGKVSKKRFVQKLKHYNHLLQKGFWTQEHYQAHVRPLVAFTEYAQAQKLRQKLLPREFP